MARLLPRRQYLALANVDVELFKTLQRRNQTPVGPLIGGSSGRDEDTGYLPAEAVMLAVANRLVDLAPDREAAKKHVERNYDSVIGAIRIVEDGAEAWLLFYRLDGPHLFCEPGNLIDLTETIKERTAQADGALEFHLINVTDLIRHARQTADALGFKESLIRS